MRADTHAGRHACGQTRMRADTHAGRHACGQTRMRADTQVCPYKTPRHDGVSGANLRVRVGANLRVRPSQKMMQIRCLFIHSYNQYSSFSRELLILHTMVCLK